MERRQQAGLFDAPHLQAIHRYIFQDVFDWAGEFRTVNISKSGDSFAFHEFVRPSLHKTFDDLRSEHHLRGAAPARFANRAAHYLGEINAIHPFREGNGRAQREFIRQLALRNGLIIDWKQISQDQMIEASRRSLRVDNIGFEEILKSAVTFPDAAPASSSS
ncbi:MAG TPA: Fic family protein [Bryobacteraceae bacterium]|nr:Fic family protein [Bryobacteraceae bacterium]